MQLRLVITVFAFVVSLLTVTIGAMFLSMALDAFAPLDPAHLGPNIPAVTQMAIKDLPMYPAMMGAVAALTTLAAIYFWRCKRPFETKAWAVVLLACVNFYAAAFPPGWFLTVYFMTPKLANSL